MALLPFLGKEFMPTLQEGSLVFRAGSIPSTSLEQTLSTSKQAETVLLTFPQVQTALSHLGRSDRGDEAMDVNKFEVFVALKPQESLPEKIGYAELSREMQEHLERALPTSVIDATQPIQMRVKELISGVKASLAVKLYGRDLDTLEQLSEKIKGALQTAPGVHELSLEANKGKLQIVIKVNREAAAQLGLNADDIIEMVQAGIGSKKVSTLMDGVQRFDIQVWLAPEFRNSMEAINNIPIRTPGGALVRLASVVSVEQGEGYTFIRREQLQRYAVIQIKVEGHDVDSFVKEAGEKIKREVKLPAGYWIEWGGAFENQQRAMAKLAVIVPLTIGLIFILLYTAFNSLKYATLIIANVPFAAIGGILSLFISGQYLLVREAVEQDATLRLRPVLMTALVEILGLQPFLLSTGVGAEVMRPLATVVVGGLLTSTALTLLLLALLYEWVEKRSERKIFEA